MLSVMTHILLTVVSRVVEWVCFFLKRYLHTHTCMCTPGPMPSTEDNDIRLFSPLGACAQNKVLWRGPWVNIPCGPKVTISVGV